MAKDPEITQALLSVMTVLGKVGAAAQMSEPVIGPFGAAHEEMVHDLIAGEWGKKWLKDFEMKIEPHGGSPALRTFWCRWRGMANGE